MDESGAHGGRYRHRLITSDLHDAIHYVLSKDAVLHRMATARDYRLFQAVNYLCALEPTDIKHRDKELTQTDAKVFGSD